MIRTLALFCLIAAPAIVSGTYPAALKRTFGINVLKWGSSYFVDLPQTNETASEDGWVQKTGPTLPSCYSSLVLWCPSDSNTVCVFTDPANGKVAGLQFSVSVDDFTPKYNMSALGFTNWTLTENSTTTTYYSIFQFYISCDMLATDVASRTNYNVNNTLQDNLYLSGFDGEVYNVSTTTAYFTDNTTSPYTEQACIPFMGHHYYYNMSTTLECSEDTLLPWFPLVYADQLIGMGMYMVGDLISTSDAYGYCEHPTQSDVEMIVPYGSQCFYDLAAEGIVTMHTYFVGDIYKILCVLESLSG